MCSYVQYLHDKHLFGRQNCQIEGFESKNLLKFHEDHSPFFVSNYILSALPDVQLEFLFESQGIGPDLYEARCDRFKHLVCERDGVFSEFFTPSVKGKRFNPYIRYQYNVSSASHQCTKLLDLVGMRKKSKRDKSFFNDLVFTYPPQVELLLLDPLKRDSVLKRTNKVWKRFFRKLNSVLCEPGQSLGCSISTHVWGSEVPVLPHLHHHVLLPHVCVDKKSKSDRALIEEAASSLYDKVRSFIDEVAAVQNKFSDSCPIDVEGVQSAGPRKKSKPVGFVTDLLGYESALDELDSFMRGSLGFSRLGWSDVETGFDPVSGVISFKTVPLDMDYVKSLWSKYVKKEFSEFDFDSEVLFDVRTKFFDSDSKNRLLHSLKYKGRSPVVDLDLFLKKCPGFVNGYEPGDLNPDAILGFLRFNLAEAVRLDRDSDIGKYESLLNKAELVFKSASVADIFSWLQWLCVYDTKTRVFGFWRNLRRYGLDLVDKPFLIHNPVCPICGGFKTFVRFVECICFDSVIVMNRGKYFLYNVKSGPPGGGIS